MFLVQAVKNTFNVFLLLLLVLAALVLLSLGHALGGYRAFVVLTGSMAPAIVPGSLIIIHPAIQYSVGDIVTRTTKSGDITITHRIVELILNKSVQQFHTKGDANDIADGELVGSGDILGKTTFIIPYIGRVVNYTKTKQGFFLMVLIPSLLVIVEEALNIIEVLRRRRSVGLRRMKPLKVL